MSFKQRVVMLASIGFGIGVIVGVLICAFSSTLAAADGTLHLCSKGLEEAVGDPLIAFTIQAFISGIDGALAVGGSAVYSIESWPLLKCTIVHYVMVMIAYYTMGFSLRWFTLEHFEEPLIMFFVMTFAYGVIWLINYISSRIEISRLNKELEDKRNTKLEGAK